MITYISNFIVAGYTYHPYERQSVKDYRSRGGLAIINVIDGSYREVEASELVKGYFDITTLYTDSSRTHLLFGLINVEGFGIETDPHEVDVFKWNINSGESPTKIPKNEFRNNIKVYSVARALKEITTTNVIANKYTNRDYVFVYNDKMMVWSHQEEEYYNLRTIPNYSYRQMRFIFVDGTNSVKVSDGRW